MSTTPEDYKSLIARIQDRGGPLTLRTMERPWSSDGRAHVFVEWGGFGDPVSLSKRDMWINEDDKETIAGALRRDMVARRLVVQHVSADSPPYETAHWVKWALRGGTQEHEMGVSPDDDVLRAHLLAWLDAADKLGWQASSQQAGQP